MSVQSVLSLATVPDINALRLAHGFGKLSDEGVLNAALHLQNQQSGSRELPLYQQRIIAVSVVNIAPDQAVEMFSLGPNESSEASLINRFFNLLADSSTLIAWDFSTEIQPLINISRLRNPMAGTVRIAQGIDLSDAILGPTHGPTTSLLDFATSLGLAPVVNTTQSDSIECLLSNDFGQLYKATNQQALMTALLFSQWRASTGAISADDHKTCYSSLTALMTKA